nr:OB-fold nucleic acid binding domain-containing protein [Secundilactobacillus oryzae]
MAFVTGEDLTGEISITIFPNTYRNLADWLTKEQVIVVRGKVEKQREIQIVADQVQLASEVQLPSQSVTKPAEKNQPLAGLSGWMRSMIIKR